MKPVETVNRKPSAVSDPLPVLFLKGREEKRRAGDNGGPLFPSVLS